MLKGGIPMRRPLAILLTLLLAAACLPLVVFAAPAEAEAPEVPDEVEDRLYTITVQPDPDGPEGTYAIALLPYQGDTVPYDVVEPQNFIYFIDPLGDTWRLDPKNEPQAEEDAYCYLLLDSGETVMILNDDTLDPQSLPDSAPGVHFTSEHLHKCKKASLYKTLSDSDNSGVAYDLWQYRCAVPGCDYIMEDYLATLSPMS